MIIQRDLFMMVLGAAILVVIVGFYEIVFDYSKLKEYEKEKEKEEKKHKTKGWIKRGWHNMIRDIKLKKHTKKQKIKPSKKITKKEAQKKLKKMFKD